MIDFDKLAQAMGDLDEHMVRPMIQSVAADAPELANEALNALSRGMDIIGEKFGMHEYFIADLVFAAEIFNEAMDILLPVYTSEGTEPMGTVILATVEGDLHDIGKNLVRSALQAKGLQVIDLGVNVSPAEIVQKTMEHKAGAVALSAVLTLGIESMEQTIKALTAAGIRDKLTIVVGGACLSESVAKRIKADAYCKTPEDTAALCLAAMKKP